MSILAYTTDLTQISGWIAALFVVASFQARNLPWLIGLQMIGYVFLATHFWLLGALSGFVITIIGIVRLMAAGLLQRFPQYRRYFLLFLPLIWLACLLSARAWADLLPAIGYTLGTLAIWQRHILATRLLFLAAHPFWLAYNLLVGSHGGVAMEIVNLGSSTTAILRHHGNKRAAAGAAPGNDKNKPLQASRARPETPD